MKELSHWNFSGRTFYTIETDGAEYTMNILDAFNDIENLEMVLSGMYQYFSREFSDDPAASAVFMALCEEEKSHAALVQYQRRIIRQNQKLFQDVDINIQEIREVISTIKSILDSTPRPSLEDAIKLSLRIEASTAEAHYRTVMKQSNKEFSDFLNQLGVSDKEHIGKLKAFAKNRGFA